MGKCQAFAVYVDGENYDSGYLKSVYTFQGERFTATSSKPDEARLFETEEAAERWAGSKKLDFIAKKEVRAVEVDPNLPPPPRFHDCAECAHCGDIRVIPGVVSFMAWCHKNGWGRKGARITRHMNKCASFVKKE